MSHTSYQAALPRVGIRSDLCQSFERQARGACHAKPQHKSSLRCRGLIVLQLSHVAVLLDTLQRLGLDLTDAFPGNAELLSDFFQGMRDAVG